MDFDSLSIELKCNILQYLPTLTRKIFATVSKRYSEICRSPLLRQSLTFYDDEHRAEDMIRLLRTFYRINTVTFVDYQNWEWINQLPKRSHLCSLDFSCSAGVGSIETITRLVDNYPLLRNIAFSDCDTLNDDCFDCMSQWRHLRGIYVYPEAPIINEGDIDTVDCDTGFKRFVENCHYLREMWLAYYQKITDRNFCLLITLRGVNLMELSLSCVEAVTDSSFQLLKQCTQLKILHLKKVLQMTDIGLQSLKGLYQLDCLMVEDGISLTATGFKNLFDDATFTSLREIGLKGCVHLGDDGVKLMTRRFPHLTIVNISNCTNVTKDGIQSIVDSSKCLEHLIIVGFDHINEFIMQICSELPKFKKLCIYHS